MGVERGVGDRGLSPPPPPMTHLHPHSPEAFLVAVDFHLNTT